MSQPWSDAVRQKHMRAICQEIGERLQFMMDRSAKEPSARLTALLQRFEELEQTAAPSIAPTLDELGAPQNGGVCTILRTVKPHSLV